MPRLFPQPRASRWRCLPLLALSALMPAYAHAAPAQQPPRLLVLGTPHLANPGKDSTNLVVPDVLAADRQRELVDLVDALARWQPDRIAVEWPVTEQAALDHAYANYRDGRGAPARDEIHQLAFRLAQRLGLPHVDAVDVPRASAPPGPAAVYDYADWPRATGAPPRPRPHARSGTPRLPRSPPGCPASP